MERRTAHKQSINRQRKTAYESGRRHRSDVASPIHMQTHVHSTDRPLLTGHFKAEGPAGQSCRRDYSQHDYRSTTATSELILPACTT